MSNKLKQFGVMFTVQLKHGTFIEFSFTPFKWEVKSYYNKDFREFSLGCFNILKAK